MTAAIEQRAREEAEALPAESLTTELRTRLGVLLVAYLAGAGDTQVVNEWAEGTRTPSSHVLERLRLAHQVTTIIGDRHSQLVIQAWMQGMNPDLDDFSPARFLRAESIAEASEQILIAARNFSRN